MFGGYPIIPKKPHRIVILCSNGVPNSRQVKGHLYEVIFQDSLKRAGIPFSGNPVDFKEWQRDVGKGHDLIAGLLPDIPKVELKYLSKRIRMSWFYRDWETRDADIFVTTDRSFVPLEARRRLSRQHRKLFTIPEFVEYAFKQRDAYLRSLQEGG